MAHIVMITADFNVENGDDDRTKDIIMADDMEEALVIADGMYRGYVHDDDPDIDRVAWLYDAKDMYGDAIYVNFGEEWEKQWGGRR